MQNAADKQATAQPDVTPAQPEAAQPEAAQPEAANDGSSAFSRFYSEQIAGSRGVNKSMRGGKILGGRFHGKTPEQARELLRQEFASMDDATKADYASRASGADLKPNSSALPFAQSPTTSMTGMDGKTVKFGQSPSAPARAEAMQAQTAAASQAGADAVKYAQAAQAADPVGVAKRAQAAKSAVLGKDGITDMGGGTMAMQNQYGSGFAQQIDASKPRAPGRIFDEKGEVDMPIMMAKKGQQVDAKGRANSIQYMENGGDAIGAGVSGNIQQSIADAAPGMEGRRSADIARSAAIFSGALPPAFRRPDDNAPGIARTPAPVDDTPGASAAAAHAGMMSIKPAAPTVTGQAVDSAIAGLPPSLRVAQIAKVQPAARPGPLPPSYGVPKITR